MPEDSAIYIGTRVNLSVKKVGDKSWPVLPDGTALEGIPDSRDGSPYTGTLSEKVAENYVTIKFKYDPLTPKKRIPVEIGMKISKEEKKAISLSVLVEDLKTHHVSDFAEWAQIHRLKVPNIHLYSWTS